jgi:iron complex outermembrane receptor protein
LPSLAPIPGVELGDEKMARKRVRPTISVRLVAATAAACIGLGAEALAQAADPAERPEQIAQADRPRSFSIPPQPLASALERFADQAGVSFAYRTGDISTLNSPGVSGTLPPREALQQILSGTGVTFTFAGASTVTLVKPAGSSGATVLDAVQVQGVHVPPQAMIGNVPPPYAGGQVAKGSQVGLLGNRDVMDTPFNQTSYTAKKAQDQQARTIRDVLADDPSLRAVFPNGGVGSDDVIIRGLQVTNQNISYGGLYGMLPFVSIMSEMAERVEVLKGPSAMLNGMQPGQALGGTINLVPKRAPETPLTQLTANYSSSAQLGGHVDFARRFGPDNQVGVRFNGIFRAGDTDIAWNSDQRGLAVLGLDFRGDRVRLAADLGYQSQYVGGLVPFIALATNVPLPWAPDARKNIGQPWGYANRTDLFGVVRGEVDITESVTAFAAAGAHDSRLDQLGGFTVTASNFNGNAASTPINQRTYNTLLTAQGGIRALVDTGPFGHELALVASTFSQSTGNGTVLGTAFATNLYGTNVVARPNLATPIANKTSVTTLSGVSVADTVSMADKRIQLTVGGRFQQVNSENFNVVTGAQTSSYGQNALSPAVAVLVKPRQNVSVYGNFIQGLEQGDTVGPNFANAGTVFPPYKTTQYEAGVKVDWGKLTTTVSLFQITRPTTITDVATNTVIPAGERRNRGLELNFFGEPIDSVRLLGGVMFLEAVLARTQGGLTDGWIAPTSPGVQFNIAGEWDLPFVRGLTVTGRVTYTGAQYIDTTYPRRMLPDWTRVDLGFRYAFDNPAAPGRPLVARFNVENVFDNDYWASGSSGVLALGAPRTFRLALTADF